MDLVPTGVTGWLQPGSPLIPILLLVLGVPVVSIGLKLLLRAAIGGRARTARADPVHARPLPQDGEAPAQGPRMDRHRSIETTYPAAPGVRYTATLGLAALLWVIRPALPSETGGVLRQPGFSLSGEHGWEIFALIAVVCLLYLRHIWTYRIELDGPYISWRTLGFRRHAHDLRELENIADGGPYTLRLYFRNGARGDLMKQVTGRTELRARLEAYRP
ncbi:hypothetical protein [Maritimibacter sp. UBA3975]|uniref:hypothetical protein n=1 Tax=Maritimibacter sp. UBA3975 TaxID=1946833 RepID=UPI000C09BC0B|nr:hypothetical protein [Maritimibacter sp. UBA3975]MAM63552.1 hypothetical protein [Maritimibacter sp.]|tara:strand:- start:55813 stop:56466 length:654 start_codon:yes stop_codon:yes gene_type:complete